MDNVPHRRRLSIGASDYTVENCGYHTPCWVAKTRKRSKGYPLTRIDGREVYMHRAMYEQEIGIIPGDLQIDHLCRFTYCIRPDHLETVTPAVNSRRRGNAKLTPEKAHRVRYDGENARVLAAELGVSEFLIYQIRQGRVWKGI